METGAEEQGGQVEQRGDDGSGHLSPKMAPWHTEHFRPREFENTTEAGRSL